MHTRITRRDLLAAAAGTFALGARPARATKDLLPEVVLRRPKRPEEDDDWYGFTQPGRWNAAPDPVIVPYRSGKVLVHYPQNADSGRLLVFSHEALASPQVYRPLLQHLASHGFVVAAPVHDDSVLENGAKARRVDIQGASTWDPNIVLNDTRAVSKRVEACTAPLESPETMGAAIGMTVDAGRPLVAGHEFGAYVAGLLMGAVPTADGGRPMRFKDDRWFAGAMLSAQGQGVMGLDASSWSSLTRPLLVVQGGLDTDASGQEPGTKVDPYSRSPAGNKHLAWFPAGDRSMYLTVSGDRPDRAGETAENLKAVMAAFARAYCDYDRDTFGRLVGDWAERSTLGKVVTAYR